MGPEEPLALQLLTPISLSPGGIWLSPIAKMVVKQVPVLKDLLSCMIQLPNPSTIDILDQIILLWGPSRALSDI